MLLVLIRSTYLRCGAYNHNEHIHNMFSWRISQISILFGLKKKSALSGDMVFTAKPGPDTSMKP